MTIRISRAVAHSIHNKLQEVMSFIELEQDRRAKTAIREITDLVNSNVESAEEEKVRKEHEASECSDQ